jgi:hypothetical protein
MKTQLLLQPTSRGLSSASLKLCLSAGAALLLSAAQPARAQVLFTDDFEAGVSGSSWQVMVPNPNYQILYANGAHAIGTLAARQEQANPFPYYMRTIAGSHPSAGILTAGQSEIFTAYMWDDMNDTDGSGGQLAAGVMLSSVSSATGAADDFYQININSGAAGGFGFYNWRTAAQTTFNSGVARTLGWHEFQIVVDPYTGANDVHFFIDKALVGTGNRKPGSGQGDVMDEIRLGISIYSQGSSFWYDNVSLQVIPEPASSLLLLLGGSMMFLYRRARA